MFSKRFSFYASTLLLGLSLTSCGYAIEKSHQEFTLLTPEAENAQCFVYVDGIKYNMHPPQTITISKSENDMEIDCRAPGNRNQKLTVPAKLTERAIWDGPGVAWDYASKSLYHYPSVVALDFSQETIKPFDLPKHNSNDIMKPEDHLLEEITSAEPRLNADRDAPQRGLKRREELEKDMMYSPNNLLPEPDEDKLINILEQLHETEPEAGGYTDSYLIPNEGLQDALPAMDPDGPIQLYPGQ